MEELIAKMEEFPNLDFTINQWCVQNLIERPKVMGYALEKVSKLYENFLDKYGSQENAVFTQKSSNEIVWLENELILFQWTVIAYSLVHKIHLKDFNNLETDFLSSIFRQKQSYIIEYEIKCLLIKGKQIRNSWKKQEEELLAQIIGQMPEKNKWNQIARQLYKLSEGEYFRQGKHCRERWHSYVQIKRQENQWSLDSDIQLLQLISVVGKRWSMVTNKFSRSKNKLCLKKRYKILLEEARNKFDHSISEKDTIALLLKAKYKQNSQGKNKINSQRKKSFQKEPFAIHSWIQAQNSNEAQYLSSKECQNMTMKKPVVSECSDYGGKQIKNILGIEAEYCIDQEKGQTNELCFYYPAQGVQNMYPMGCFQMGYSQPILNMYDFNQSQCVNFFNFGLLPQGNSPYSFF